MFVAPITKQIGLALITLKRKWCMPIFKALMKNDFAIAQPAVKFIFNQTPIKFVPVSNQVVTYNICINFVFSKIEIFR